MTAARRIVTVLVGGTLLLAGASTASATGEDGPGSNDLQLQVERLEQASQADVTGAAASAMLFFPGDSEAMAATEQARRSAREAATSSLFVVPCAPYRSAGSTESLFAASTAAGDTDSSTHTSADGSAGAQQSGGVPWALLGLGVLLVGGLVLSYLARDPEVDPHG